MGMRCRPGLSHGWERSACNMRHKSAPWPFLPMAEPWGPWVPEFVFGTRPTANNPADCKSMGLSPAGITVAMGDNALRLHLWDLAAGKHLRQFDLRNKPDGQRLFAANCATFSPDGKTLAVGDLKAAVGLWEVASGRELYC